MSNIPAQIKWSGLAGTLMLVPFTVAIIANMVSVATSGHPLYQTWLWSFPVLRTWMLILPGLALALAIFSYISYAATNRGKWLHLKQLWPVAIVGILAFGILFVLRFHDSGQCVLRNPSYALQHPQQTLVCILNN